MHLEFHTDPLQKNMIFYLTGRIGCGMIWHPPALFYFNLTTALLDPFIDFTYNKVWKIRWKFLGAWSA